MTRLGVPARLSLQKPSVNTVSSANLPAATRMILNARKDRKSTFFFDTAVDCEEDRDCPRESYLGDLTGLWIFLIIFFCCFFWIATLPVLGLPELAAAVVPVLGIGLLIFAVVAVIFMALCAVLLLSGGWVIALGAAAVVTIVICCVCACLCVCGIACCTGSGVMISKKYRSRGRGG